MADRMPVSTVKHLPAEPPIMRSKKARDLNDADRLALLRSMAASVIEDFESDAEKREGGGQMALSVRQRSRSTGEESEYLLPVVIVPVDLLFGDSPIPHEDAIYPSDRTIEE